MAVDLNLPPLPNVGDPNHVPDTRQIIQAIQALAASMDVSVPAVQAAATEAYTYAGQTAANAATTSQNAIDALAYKNSAQASRDAAAASAAAAAASAAGLIATAPVSITGSSASPILTVTQSGAGYAILGTGVVRASTETQGNGLRVGPNAGAPVYNYPSSNGNLNQSGPFDLFWDAYNRKLHVRNVIIEDVGDPPDLVLRRGGEDVTGYPDNPAAKGTIHDGTNTGTLYWCAMNSAGSYGGRLAQIYVRAKGDQTALNNGGDLFIGVMPEGSIGNPSDTFGIYGSGVVAVMRDNGKGSLTLPTGTNTGLTIGADTNLYRSAANTLKTDDALVVALTLAVTGTTTLTGAATLTGGISGILTQSHTDTAGWAATIRNAAGSGTPSGLLVLTNQNSGTTPILDLGFGSVSSYTSRFKVDLNGLVTIAQNATIGGTLAVTGVASFTAAPTGPTAAVDTNTTALATTAYVIGQGYLKSAAAASTYAPLASPSFTGSITVASAITATAGAITATAGNGSFNGARVTAGIGPSGNSAVTIGLDASKIELYRGAANQLNFKNVSGGILIEDGAVLGAAGTTAHATFRIPHGAAPTSPVDGDMWTTTAGLFIRINGVTKTVTLT